jgi:hypothetical protein
MVTPGAVEASRVFGERVARFGVALFEVAFFGVFAFGRSFADAFLAIDKALGGGLG